MLPFEQTREDVNGPGMEHADPASVEMLRQLLATRIRRVLLCNRYNRPDRPTVYGDLAPLVDTCAHPEAVEQCF